MYNRHVVKDSYEFVDIMIEHLFPSSFFMCSFDVVSLFTNVPLDETVDICCKALFHSGDCPDVNISEKSFRELILMVTSGVEFTFEDVMYRQIDGVAMGGPLGPVLANMFVGYCETLIPEGKLPPLHCGYVDDSFSCFASKSDSFVFLDVLNNLHPSLKFTCEFEECGRLPFLDVLVEKSVEGGVLTYVYRKPTFTGLYIVWDSFCTKSYKIILVRNLVDRAHRICSKSLLETELDVLRGLFSLKGYPEYVVKKYVTPSSLQSSPVCSDVRPVYVRLPWKGDSVSRDTERQVRSVVESNYHDVTVRFVYSTSRALMVKKDVLPTAKQRHVTYLFECQCRESRYIGRTLQHLDTRIRQHVPLSLLSVDPRGSRPRRGRPPKCPLSMRPEEGCGEKMRPEDGCKGVAQDGAVASSVKEKSPDDVVTAWRENVPLRRSARLSGVTVNDVALSGDSVTSSAYHRPVWIHRKSEFDVRVKGSLFCLG